MCSGIFHLRVPETAQVGSAVGRIRAHDLDVGSNAEVDYAIVPGDEGKMFEIISNGQSQEGVVVLKRVRTLTTTHTLMTADIHYQLSIKLKADSPIMI